MNRIKFILTLGLSFGLSIATHAGFEEKEITVNDGVAGKLVTPGNKTNKAVLILHGLNDHMDAVGDLQKHLAHALGEVGIGSVRINFRGEGVRNNSVITSTLDTRKADAEAAYRVLKKQFPNANYGVSGFSMGGSTSILLMGSHPDWFQTAVLWSSGGHNLKDNIAMSSDPTHAAMIRKTLREGQAVYKTWVDITYTRENYISWIGFDSADYLKHYKGAFLGIRGTNDFLPLHEVGWMDVLTGDPVSYQVISGADHIFNVLDPENSQGELVVRSTVDWLVETLK